MDETGWLIEEANTSNGPWWWTARTGSDFSTDANEAIRFARKCDAERIIRLMFDERRQPDLFASEHLWCAPTTDGPGGKP